MTVAGDCAVGMLEGLVTFGWLSDDDAEHCAKNPLAGPNTPRPPQPSTTAPAAGFRKAGKPMVSGVRR